MRLKFIGTDDSMKLRYGEVYDVTIKSSRYFIWAHVKKIEKSDGFYNVIECTCPYSSPQSFANNWSTV